MNNKIKDEKKELPENIEDFYSTLGNPFPRPTMHFELKEYTGT